MNQTLIQNWLSYIVIYFALESPLKVWKHPVQWELYLCPADDFAVGFELRAVEDLDAGDGLHGLSINRADHSGIST